MASTYTTNSGIEKPGDGEQSGTWGDTVNTNMDIIDTLVSGFIQITAGSTSVTLTTTDGSVTAGMNKAIKYVDSGDLGGNCTVTIAPNDQEKLIFVENGLSASRSLIFTQGSGANFTLQAGKQAIIRSDGAGSGAAVSGVLANLEITTLEVTGAAALDGAATLGSTLTVTGASQFNSTITAGVDDTGYDVKFFGDTASRYWLWDTSADGVVQRGTLTVGVDDAGHDVKFFGDTASAYMLWDASTDDLILGGAAKLGVGETDPDTEIHAHNASAGSAITLTGASGYVNQVLFGSTANPTHGRVTYQWNTSNMNFATGNSSDAKMTIGSAEVVVNEPSNDIDFRVESDGNANMLFVDGGNNRVGIATASPSAPAILEVYANSTDTGGTILINQAGAGDPALQFKTAATNYVVGVDNSDSDIFKIDYGTTGVGASTGFSMNTSGHSSFHDKQVSRLNLKDYGEVTSALGSAGGARTIDLENGNNFTATVSASTVTWTFSNPTASDELCGFTLFLTNGGSQTVNWPASVDWAGGTAPTLTSSGLDILVFITTDGGTIWHGMVSSADSKSPS